MPPNNEPTVHRVEQALLHGLDGLETLLVGEINARLAQPWYRHKEDLATAIVNCGLVEQKLHFISIRRYRGKGGWSRRMWRYGRSITFRGD